METTRSSLIRFCVAFFLLSFYHLNLEGQHEQDSLNIFGENEDFEDDSLWLNYSYTSIEDEWPIEDDTLIHPIVSRNVTLRYQTFAKSYLRINDSDPRLGQLNYFLHDGNNSIRSLNHLIDSNGNLVIDSLLIDENYYLAYTGINGLEFIASINTFERFSETDEVDLKSHMFDEISWWLRHPNGQNIFQFVNTQTDWHTIEKLWFIQQFVYYGKALPDSHATTVPTTADTSIITTKSPCLCRPLRLTISIDNEPKGGKTIIDEKNGNWSNVWGGDEGSFNGGKGKRWHAYGMRGPAKYNQVWIESPRCTNGNIFKNTIGFDEELLEGTGAQDEDIVEYTGGNKAILKYVFACLGVDDYTPEDCSCERQMSVRVCYRYASQTNAEAETLRGGWCKKASGVHRSALAQAEDVAFLAWTNDDDDPDSYQIDASGMVAAGVACGQSADWGKFGANILKAGFYAFKALKPAKDPLNIAVAIFYGYKLADQIEELLTTPIISRSGICGFQEAPGAGLLNKCVDIDLNINKTSVAVLQSNSIVHVQGQGRFKANARVLSAYGMTGTLMRSDPDIAGEVCCRTGSGVYNLSGTLGFNLLTEEGLRPWVSARFLEQGIDLIDNINNINGQFGYRGGGVREDCLIEIENPIIIGLSLPEYQTSKNIKITLEQRANHIYVNNGITGDWELVVRDISGKVVFSKRGSGIHNEYIQFNNFQLSKGMYIATYSYGKGYFENLKLVNH